MQENSYANEGLSLLFQRDGVPPDFIMYGSKEHVQSEFWRNLKESSCHMKQVELYSPCHNTAKSTIGDMKKGASNKIINTRSPKKLWDNCLELKGYIRSNIFT